MDDPKDEVIAEEGAEAVADEAVAGDESVASGDAPADELSGGEGESSEDDSEDEAVEEVAVETAKYEITGLVDFRDEQGNIRGQFPIGSIQELPVFAGDAAVEAGQATRVE